MTADKAALLDLRDRLKAATGPDYDLDVALECTLCGARALGLEYSQTSRDTYRCVKGTMLYNPPAYTGSLDAAVGLVPEGMVIENLGEMRDSGPWTGHWLAQFSPRGPRPRLAPGPITAATVRAACDGLPTVRAATPALALCLARIEYEIAKVTDRSTRH